MDTISSLLEHFGHFDVPIIDAEVPTSIKLDYILGKLDYIIKFSARSLTTLFNSQENCLNL